MALLDPTTWEVWDYVLVGLVLTILVLLVGYGLGILWHQWRDGRKKA